MSRERQTGLNDYGAGGLPEPPVVILDTNAEPVKSPTDASKIVGHIGVDKHRDGRAFVSRKVHAKHYYHAGGGYAISKKLLHYLKNHHVRTLYMFEKESRTCYEFGIEQYTRDAERVEHAPAGDPQVVLPTEEARHVWLDHGDPKHDVRPGAGT